MSRSSISWLARLGTIPESWSPVTGCTPVSRGCEHCWAAVMVRRFPALHGGPGVPYSRIAYHPARMGGPERWRKRRTCFICPMGDLFHADVQYRWVAHVLVEALMAAAKGHTMILCSKRPERMQSCLGTLVSRESIPGLWGLVSVEDQAAANERIPWLLRTHGLAVRGVSVEPMLGPVDLRQWLDRLQWAICGGESGPGARPMKESWVRDLVDQSQDAGIPVFVKQWWGGRPIPLDLVIRQWPEEELDELVSKK